MCKQVVILGAGGHGKVIADIVRASGDRVLGFRDDDPCKGEMFAGFPILGRIAGVDETGNPLGRNASSIFFNNSSGFTGFAM